MKMSLRLALISLTLGAGAQAAPSMTIGDGAELFLTGNVAVRSDDNIYLSRSNESDLIFDVAPGVDLVFGERSQVKGSLTMAHTFTSYTDNSDLNTDLFAGDFLTEFDDGKLKAAFDAGFHQLNQNSVDIRPLSSGQTPGLVRRDIFSSRGDAEVEISQITSVGAGIAFSHENFKEQGFTDADSLTLPLDVYYEWTAKSDVSLGYRFRDYQVDQFGIDSKDHFFNVGARGEFTPKLTGKFAVGMITRKLDNGHDDTNLGVDASFNYEVSPKTGLQFGVSNDFGTSPQGQQQENFILSTMISSKLNPEWNLHTGVSYRQIDYKIRKDDYYEGQFGASYVVSTYVRLVGAYVYRKYNSDIRANGFTNHVFSIAANLRY